MSKRRVVVTGLGIVSPVGSTVASAWETVLRGESGIGLITRFDTTQFATRIGGAVRDFDIGAYMSPKEARRMDEFIHYGVAAGVQAVQDSTPAAVALSRAPASADWLPSSRSSRRFRPRKARGRFHPSSFPPRSST